MHPDNIDPGPDPEPVDELRRLWRSTLELAERMQADRLPYGAAVEQAADLLAVALWTNIECDNPTHEEQM